MRGSGPTEGRSRRWVAPLVGSASALALACGAAVVIVQRDPSGAPGADALWEPPVVAEAGDRTEPGAVCGLGAGAQAVADGVDREVLGGLVTLVEDVRTVDGSVETLVVQDGTAYVLERADATYTVTAYDAGTGRRTDRTTVPLTWDEASETFGTGSLAVGADGDYYLLDTLMGRRDLVRVAPGGDVVGRTTLPAGPQTTGAVVDLLGLAAWPDAEHGTVVGVLDAGRVLHRVAADGSLLDEVAIDGRLRGLTDDGDLVLGQEGEARAGLSVVDPATGEVRAAWGSGPAGGGPRTPLPWVDASGAASGPGGEGLLLVDPAAGLRWFGEDGVRRGVWPDVHVDIDQVFTVHDGTPLVHDADRSYLLTDGPDGAVALTRVDDTRTSYELSAPIKLNAANEELVATLGLGAGLATDRPFHVFGADEQPRVIAAFDESWGASAGTYRLRYEVRGDPRVPDPVVGDSEVVALPSAGGEVELVLPPARPGVYEVDAALVTEDGRAVSGTCLRYTITPPGVDLDLGALTEGADWGGPAPLRGVQLADRLGVGSHRVQLDFGALVPEPTSEPDPAAIDWGALPGAALSQVPGEQDAGDPFADLRAAAREALAADVVLAVQVGQGGDAERAAVEAGTWEGWVREIVAGVRRGAPGVRHWEPWNEPNNTGYDDGARYEREVGAPFAAGARAADPDVVVVGGNTLGFATDWWQGVVEAGGCASLDVVAVHPYTGMNRSWEEEGFSADGAEMDQLREVLAPCGDLPLWDTESGWWSDGGLNVWASAWDVVRKLVWYDVEGVEEWTYFFSEGGFGETGNSWSLVQHGAYVKPAGAAFAATASALDELRDPVPVDVDVPGVHAVRYAGPDGAVLALWTEDLSTEVVLDPGPTEVAATVRDVYGAERTVEVLPGGTRLAVDGAPVLVSVPAGADLAVGAVLPFGPDLLQGAEVRVTSAHPDAGSPAAITSGTFALRDPWRTGRLEDGSVDLEPSVEVLLDEPVTVDRIAVATPAIRCCSAGLRDYTVSVRLAGGAWQEVGNLDDQFWDRVVLLEIDPVEVTGVRVDVPTREERGTQVLDVNYSGVVGGLHPSFMPLETESDWVVSVSAVRAWGPPG